MIAGSFNEWFTLAHKQRTSDGQGGFAFAFVQYAKERGRMSRLGRGTSAGKELNIGEQLQEWEMHIFYGRPGLLGTIQRGDQVTDSNGVNYLVTAIRHPTARPIRQVEAECREVQPGS